jgi:hypothetical protein
MNAKIVATTRVKSWFLKKNWLAMKHRRMVHIIPVTLLFFFIV